MPVVSHPSAPALASAAMALGVVPGIVGMRSSRYSLWGINLYPDVVGARAAMAAFIARVVRR